MNTQTYEIRELWDLSLDEVKADSWVEITDDELKTLKPMSREERKTWWLARGEKRRTVASLFADSISDYEDASPNMFRAFIGKKYPKSP